MRLVGLALLIALLLLATGEYIHAFVDVASAIIVLAFLGGALLFARAPVATMFRASFAAAATPEQLGAGARGWAQARTYCVAGGIIGTLIGAIIMLINLDDIQAIGPGLAMGLLTILYGLILGYGVCLPMQMRLEDRARETG